MAAAEIWAMIAGMKSPKSAAEFFLPKHTMGTIRLTRRNNDGNFRQ
jgi:hypothetical protein